MANIRRGAPDFGATAPLIGLPASVDTGEIAPSLGSPNTIDRRGHVVFYDDFENGIVQWTDNSDPTSSFAIENTRAWTGTQCVRLQSTDAADEQARMQKSFQLLAQANFGIEIIFQNFTNCRICELTISYFDGNNNYIGRIRYDFTTQLLQYSNSSLAWTTLQDFSALGSEGQAWLYMKLVIDNINHQYKRVRFGRNEYTPDDLDLWSNTSSAFDAMTIEIEAEIAGGSGGVGGCCVDNVVFTIDEQ